jgi:hypothetical protein
VTDLALLRDPGRHVIWIRRPLEISQVARDTRSRGQVEVAIRVALIALQLRVSACQRKPNRIMIEVGGLPGRGRVAILASLRESKRHVIRAASLLEIRQMAADASGGRSRVLPSRVTSYAIQRRVHTSQCESRKFRVIKSHALPVVDRVAILTLR